VASKSAQGRAPAEIVTAYNIKLNCNLLSTGKKMNWVLEYIQCASGNGVQQNYEVAFEWNKLAVELELGKFMVT
jgi:hypothetical protein